MMAWTKEQSRAIENTSENVLVSASAGSGKTAVMVERAARIVIKCKVPISELLIMTFASDAAAEMKQRLYIRLAEELKNPQADRAFLSAQLDGIDSSYICTLHSFCLDLLRMYFYETDLDPQFSVLDPADAEVLKRAVLDELTAERVEEGKEEFLSMTEIFLSGRSDKLFKETVLRLHEFALSEVSPRAFLTEGLFKAYTESSSLLDFSAELIAAECAVRVGTFERFAGELRAMGFLKGAKNAEELAQKLGCLSSCKSYSALTAELEREEKGTPAETKSSKGMTEAGLYKIRQLAEERKDCLAFLSDARKKLSLPSGELERLRERAIAQLGELSKFCLEFAERFHRRKREENTADFSDFEHYAIDILEDDRIAESVSRRFKYVFVDEYQDTSRVQERILSRVSGKDNLFTVGDLKQSIYAFRRCDPQIFSDRGGAYERGEGCRIDLNMNFRSESEILQFADGVMSACMTEKFGGVDYRQKSVFIPGAEYVPAAGAKASVHLAEKPKKQEEREESKVYDIESAPLTAGEDAAALEGELIARIIERCVGESVYDVKQKKMRKLTLGDITILSRNMDAYATGVRTYLETVRGIPVSSIVKQNSKEAELLVDLLAVIDNPRQDYPLIAVMLSPFGDFSAEELAQIKLIYRESGGEGKFFFSAAEHVRDTDGALADKTRFFYDFLFSLHNMASFSSIAAVLEYAVSERKYDDYVLSLSYGAEKYLAVTSFLNQLETGKYRFDLTGYLSDVQMGKAIFPGGGCAGGESVVKMTTVHRSKGLEYPVVIYMGAGRDFNMRDLKERLLLDKDYGGALDSYDLQRRIKIGSPIKAALALKCRYQNLQEELRLTYVALTRAKNRLYVTGKIKDAGKRIEGGGQFNPYAASCAFDFLLPYLSEGTGAHELAIYSPEQLHAGEKSDRPLQAKSLPEGVDARLAGAIEKKLRFPYAFEDSVLSQKYTVTGIGSARDEADQPPARALFSEESALGGTAYHLVMESCDFVSPSIENVRETIEGLILQRRIDAGTEVDAEQILACLNSPLLRALSKCKLYREKEFMLYVNPGEIGLNGSDKVLVQGKIDLIAVEEDGATVLDFKSGRIHSREQAVLWYGKQLDLYAMAVEKVLKIPVKHRIVYSLALNRHFYCD